MIFFICLSPCDKDSMCSPACPSTHDPPVSALQVLGLQACTTMLIIQNNTLIHAMCTD